MESSSTVVRRAAIRRIASSVAGAEQSTGGPRTTTAERIIPDPAAPRVKLLEVTRKSTPLRALWAEAQREALTAHNIQTLTLDSTGLTPGALSERLQRLLETEYPDAVILRGGEVLAATQIPRTSGIVPFIFEHCTPYEFGASTPHRAKLALMRLVICYSAVAEEGLRAAGVSRVKTCVGPCIPAVELPLPAEVTVGVLKTAADAAQTLSSIVAMKERLGRQYRIVSSIKMSGVDHLPSDVDVVEASSVVVAPVDFGDVGQPHEGAALSLSFGRALITSKTSALAQVNLPTGTFIQVVKYSASSYASAVEVFLQNSRPFIDGHKEDRVFSDPVPAMIRKVVEKR
jgi:hypothetical protein